MAEPVKRDPRNHRRPTTSARRVRPRRVIAETPDWAAWLTLGVILAAGVYGLALALGSEGPAAKQGTSLLPTSSSLPHRAS